MSISRRDFMKLFGIGMASILMTRCRPPQPTCYTQVAPPYTDEGGSLRGRLSKCWLSFGDLAQQTRENGTNQNYENDFGQRLITEHRNALDELVVSGELTVHVADLIHEAYQAAVYHVWRSNTLVTCYTPTMYVNYAPISANVLVEQSRILGDLNRQSTIDPQTLDKAQAALEHDLAYYDLSDADMHALNDQLMKDAQEGRQSPSFDELPLDVTPDAKAAAQFIINLLTGK